MLREGTQNPARLSNAVGAWPHLRVFASLCSKVPSRGSISPVEQTPLPRAAAGAHSKGMASLAPHWGLTPSAVERDGRDVCSTGSSRRI